MSTRGFLARRPKKANTSNETVKAHRRRKIPPWDNSISNLLVYKLTEEELRRRHELHQPIIRRELDSDDDELHSSGIVGHDKAFPRTPNGNDMSFPSRTITDSNEKLQNALIYSDKRLSAVRDMFGDDPKKFRGFPNVTSAPITQRERHAHHHGVLSSPALVKEVSLGSSQLDILSDTIMDDAALNDLDEYDNITKDDEPKKNTHLTNSVNENVQEMISVKPSSVVVDAPIKQDSVVRGVDSSAEHQDVPKSANSNRKTNSENDEKRATPNNSWHIVDKGRHDLRQMLNDLEEEVRMYEQETGREHFSSPRIQEQNSFSGFTVTVLNTVTKLVKYLRDEESQRKTDMKIEEELLLGFEEQHILMNSLTNDIIHVREENTRLKDRLEACENEIRNFKNKGSFYAGDGSDGAAKKLPDQQMAQFSNNTDEDGQVFLRPFKDEALEDDERTNCSININRNLFAAEQSENSQNSDDLHIVSITTKDANLQHEMHKPNHGESAATTTVDDFMRNCVYGKSNESDVSPQLHTKDGVTMGNDITVTSSFTPTVMVNEFPPQQTTPPSPHCYDTRQDPLPTNTQNNNNINRMPQSVFLGRNHTMSPHRKSTSSNKRGGQEKIVTPFGNYQDPISEQRNSGRGRYPGVNDVNKKHFSIVGPIPAVKDDERSPDISPVSRDSYQGGIRTAKSDKIVVTLPSIWQDAESKPRKGISREGTFTMARKYDVNNNNMDQGWFALSNHVGHT